MRSFSRPPAAERAKPLLGTLVRIRAEHASLERAHAAIDAAFGRVAETHRLMSFHEAGSDVSRINREAHGEAVAVDRRTAEVLAFALDLAGRSGGAFDPTIGARAVAARALPRPASSPDADPSACWRHVSIDGKTVRLTAPLWIDLGGIAKGFAVDDAVACLQEHGVMAGCVDAGGDLRVFGPDAALVGLRVAGCDSAPVVEIADGALASSGGDPAVATAHFRGGGDRIDAARFACVTAPSCMAADALTKVVLALGLEGATGCLVHHGASAHCFSPAFGWLTSEAPQ